MQVPAPLRSQLVFRMELDEHQPPASIEGTHFWFCSTVKPYLGLVLGSRKAAGWGAVLKNALKIASGRRMFYCVTEDRSIAHYGWLTVGHCRHYHIERDAVVIGPIWSSPSIRGRGVATMATKRAIDEVLRLGYTTIYIDTAYDNVSCLRVIEKCGFGPPLATFIRPQEVRGESL